MKDFIRCGKGEYIDSYGFRWVGEFKNNELNGKGERIFPDGSR